jgi:hypothetical protein
LKNMWNCSLTQHILSHSFYDWKLCELFLLSGFLICHAVGWFIELNNIQKGKACYYEDQVISMLEFLIDNIVVSVGGTVSAGRRHTNGYELCRLKNMWNCSLTQHILSHSFYDWKLCELFLLSGFLICHAVGWFIELKNQRLTTSLPILFQYCYQYCYSDSRNLWAVMKAGGLAL